MPAFVFVEGPAVRRLYQNHNIPGGDYLATHNLLPWRMRLEEIGGTSFGGGRVDNGFCALAVTGLYFFQVGYGGNLGLKILFLFKRC